MIKSILKIDFLDTLVFIDILWFYQ